MPPCVGDCDADGAVSVDELLRGIGISLGNVDVASCDAFDRDGDGLVRVDEIVVGTNNALAGCVQASAAIQLEIFFENPDELSERIAVGFALDGGAALATPIAAQSHGGDHGEADVSPAPKKA